MSERYDFGGKAWGVGPELTQKRLMMDAKEAEDAFVTIAQNVHGKGKFDYSKTQFRSMRIPVIVIKKVQGQDTEFLVNPIDHLVDKLNGGIE